MKRTIIIILAVALLFCTLSACGASSTMTYSERAKQSNDAAVEAAGFRQIEGKEYLSYNIDTQIIYYLFSSGKINGYSYTYFAPYINENGNICRYVDGEIVEIAHETAKP